MSRDLCMLRVMAASPRVHLCDPQANLREIEALLHTADERGVSLCVFPRLCLTGSTCGDLLLHEPLLCAARKALIEAASLDVRAAFVLSLPLEIGGFVRVCTAVVSQGQIYYAPEDAQAAESLPLGGDIYAQPLLEGMFLLGDISVSLTGACDALIHVLPCAQADYQGLHARSLTQLAAQSDACALIHAGAGYGESTTDHVYSGFCAVYECGQMLAQSERFSLSSRFAIADVDADRLRHKRRLGLNASSRPVIRLPLPKTQTDGKLLRPLSPLPFLPTDNADAQLQELLDMQALALITRMECIRSRSVVLGVSGGLDSTMALLAAAYAFDRAGWDRSGIIGISMPGFGTGTRTRNNADALMERLGCTAMTIPIGAAVSQHFDDIGQSPDVHDICYENSQARERTQIVMDYANKVGALAMGTGDLSELALGWCTYGGDQMSMYNLNGSLPKTLMRALVAHAAMQLGAQDVAQDILDTPVSPELIPSSEGELRQRTEDTLGSYELHDFYLWHMMDSGASPRRLFALACHAFDGRFERREILRTLTLFIRRFFTQQFKRSAMPDGPKLTAVSLSPRGGLAMPSDAGAALYLRELDELSQNLAN